MPTALEGRLQRLKFDAFQTFIFGRKGTCKCGESSEIRGRKLMPKNLIHSENGRSCACSKFSFNQPKGLVNFVGKVQKASRRLKNQKAHKYRLNTSTDREQALEISASCGILRREIAGNGSPIRVEGKELLVKELKCCKNFAFLTLNSPTI